MSAPLPWSEPIRLNQIGAGVERTLVADAETRARVAKSLSLVSLDSLTAEIDLKPSPVGWRLDGRLRAELAQTCGVTLEPLPLDLDADFFVNFATADDHDRQDDEEVVVSLEDETPDLVEDGQIDLGQAVVEQFALQLDPFPRKPGAEFVQPQEPAEISPFAVLSKLKAGDEG